MSINALLGIGLKSMQTSQAGLQVTGHNVANAQVTGYTRQRLETQASAPQQFAGPYVGRGVEIITVRRVYEEALGMELSRTGADASAAEVRMTWMQRLEQALPPGEDGLAHAVDRFLGAWSDLAGRPDDAVLRQLVIQQGQAVADRFNTTVEEVDRLQQGMVSELAMVLEQANRLAAQVAEANAAVMRHPGGPQSANDLLDRRDRLVDELAKLVGGQTLDGDDGTVSVLVPSGLALVQGRTAHTLEMKAPQATGELATLSMTLAGRPHTLDPYSGLGGSIGGLMSVQSREWSDSRNAIASLIGGFLEGFNAQHRQGFSQAGPPPVAGADFFVFDAITARTQVRTDMQSRDIAAMSIEGIVTSPNGNAVKLARLDEEGNGGGNGSFVAAYASMIASLGLQVQQARAASGLATARQAQAKELHQSVSGVNLDEEAARLMQYQQSYQAAARVLQAAQTVMDTLLQTVGR